MLCRLICWFAAVLTTVAAFAQTTNISLNFTLTTQTRPVRSVMVVNRSAGALGVVAIRIDVTHSKDKQGPALDNDQGTITFARSRLDSFDVSVNIPNGPGTSGAARPFNGVITGGIGTFQGATGSIAFTLNVDNLGNLSLSGTGSVTAGGVTTGISLTPAFGLFLSPFSGDNNFFSGSGAVTPLGDVTAKLSLDSNSSGGNDGVFTLTFNSSDSINFFLSYSVNGPPPANTPMVVVGGTGAYAGATGSSTVTFTQVGTTFAITGNGSITQRAAGSPNITQVFTAFGQDETSQNTYIVVKGKNLVPSTTPAAGAIWSDAPEFASGMMPTVMKNIGVKINDKPGFVYFYCSAATHPGCPEDQINVLTPLDTKLGRVRVTVSNNGVETPPFAVPMRQIEPSFLTFNTLGYVAAVHLDGSLVGPTTLYPGASTPAKRNETIVAFAVGFGLPTTTLVPGSATQFGPMLQTQSPANPSCFVGTFLATVTAVTLISPGLYQFNLIVPAGAALGDNLIYCSYLLPGNPSFYTPPGNLITVGQ